MRFPVNSIFTGKQLIRTNNQKVMGMRYKRLRRRDKKNIMLSVLFVAFTAAILLTA